MPEFLFISNGSSASKIGTSIFLKFMGSHSIFILIYVDDILITGSCPATIHQFISQMRCEFSIKDLGHLHYFLGVEAQFTPQGLFLSQRQYMQDLFQQSTMVAVKPLPSPLAGGEKLSKFDGTPPLDPTPYRPIVGALQYTTLTRPDFAYATKKVCHLMQAPTIVHWAAVKHILHYIKHTLHIGFLIWPSSRLSLTTYSDTD
ncbi:uncharacterized mitochondrial protein AtMg00810-like [Nymphaea colorata]|uniref:uncharacterized mitochondrial protein AtMg00810-like n=1 Tax=Nymphaea colorata TaxID=210225 RepID=UPI00214F42A3|nr:uncharacterized mitochondrial protein AtMg00810-like [Nymphaea colorata]